MRSVTRSSATPRRWWRPTGARWSARVRHPLDRRISRRFCCRRRPRRRRSSPSPMPAATPSTRSSRRQSSASSAAGKARRHAGQHQRHRFARSEDRAGTDADRALVLGRERGRTAHSRRLRRRQWRAACHHGPCRRLRRGDCTISRRSSRSTVPRDGKAVVTKMKEMPTDDPLFGKGSDSSRWPQDSRHVPVRGEAAQQSTARRGTTTSCARRSRPRRRSGPSVKAAVRWSAADAGRKQPTSGPTRRHASWARVSRRTGHVTQALARRLRRKNSVRDRVRTRTARCLEMLEAAMQRFADRPAFRCFGQTLTYADTDRLSRQFAAYPARQARGEEG